MNSNRSKYASTPFLATRRHPLVTSEETHQEPEAMVDALPEFQPVMPPQQMMPPMNEYNPYYQQSYMSQPPVQQPMPNYMPQQPSMPFYGQAQQPYGMMQQPPMMNQPPVAPVKPSRAPFTASPADLGYGMSQEPMFNQPAMPTQQASYANQSHPPYVTSYPPPMQAPYQMSMMNGNTGGYAPVPPAYGQEYGQPYPMPQHTPQAPQTTKSIKFDATMVLSIFLFGLLPVLFVGSLFLMSTLPLLIYIFMAVSALCVAVMWFGQSFSSSGRITISVIYVALCIAGGVMLYQGGKDVTQTAATPESTPVVAQASVQPTMQITTPDPYAAPTPQPLGTSEAEKQLTEFMNLWMGMNTPDMVSLVQPSWASEQDNANASLFTILANRTPEDYDIEEISGSDNDRSRTVSMTATINKNNGKDPVKYRFMVIMVKENDQWYVDPNSLATNDAEDVEDDVVVNSEQVSDEFATEAPRMTATPVPAPSTTLYYNVDGGSFYHMDPYCSSIKEEYTPLTGTFTYAELKDYTNRLSPCMTCRAPVDPLPSE